jgi:hypothetical protein
MAGSWTADRFPQFEKAIRHLIEQHRELEDEPLRLAITYLPANRDPQHIFLLEVIHAFGESLNPERDLFEVTYEPTPGFPMGPNEQLHLILTNPRELKTALRESWPLAIEVIDAIRAGDYEVLFEDRIGKRLLAMLRAEASRQEATLG